MREVSVENWSTYVEATWPEDIENLPTQEELPELIDKGVVFIGPIIGFLQE